MNAMTLKPSTELHDLLEVDSTSPSGLRWKQARGGGKAGSIAGTQRADKYWQVKVHRKIRPVHQVVLELSGKPKPDGHVSDHLDGDPSNNSLNNLRWVPQSINCRRMRKPTGSSGLRYVTRQHTKSELYQYRFLLSSKSFGGYGYTTPSKAHTAALARRLELFWNP